VSVTDERVERLGHQVEMLLAKVEAQATEIAALNAQVTVLRTENAELRRRLGQNSSNSGKPPSSDSPADRSKRSAPSPSGRRRGGQPGHKGSKRALLPANEVDSIKDCHPPHCRRCARGLPERVDADPVRHQVWDLPEIEPIVNEYRLHHATCEICGETTCATLPEGVPQGAFGPGVLSLASTLVADGHMSRRKVVGVLDDVFGLDISLGALSEAEQIVSTAVAPAVEEIRVEALADHVKHLDATTWRQAGAYKALWVMATATVTVFTVAADATRETLRTWITRVRGVLVTDRGSQFDFWAMTRRQICWAHLIRKFVDFSERTGRVGEIGSELLLWSRLLIHSYHRARDGTCPRAGLQRVALRLRGTVERLLEEGRDLSIPGISGSCRNILEHRDALWRFVDDPAVEPTNNHAERELRGLVTWRKSSFGSQSDRGNTFAANLKSVIQTCRKQRRNVLTYLRSAVHAALHHQSTPSLVRPTP
jgi:transposase